MRSVGIEGIVAKRLAGRYPADRRTWVKVRHTSATGDAGDGHLLLSTEVELSLSRLLAEVLELLRDAAGGVEWLRDGTRYQVLRQHVAVEVDIGTTRHRRPSAAPSHRPWLKPTATLSAAGSR